MSLYIKNKEITDLQYNGVNIDQVYEGKDLVWENNPYRVWRNLSKDGILSLAKGRFPNKLYKDIKKIEDHGLNCAFYNCKGLTGSVSFPALTSVGSIGLQSAFSGCTGLTGSVSFSALTSVGSSGLNNAFSNCTGLTSASFPALTSVGSYGMGYAFYGCTGLSSVSFPALTSVGRYGFSAGSSSTTKKQYAFSCCTGITEIHFRADAQSVIQAVTGYSDQFGATNATIYFDL